jgi:hypothetical protein
MAKPQYLRSSEYRPTIRRTQAKKVNSKHGLFTYSKLGRSLPLIAGRVRLFCAMRDHEGVSNGACPITRFRDHRTHPSKAVTARSSVDPTLTWGRHPSDAVRALRSEITCSNAVAYLGPLHGVDTRPATLVGPHSRFNMRQMQQLC